MMEAWFSWSEMMKSSLPSTAETVPALAANPDVKGVFVQACETSTGATHDVRAMGLAVKKTGAIFVQIGVKGHAGCGEAVAGAWNGCVDHHRASRPFGSSPNI